MIHPYGLGYCVHVCVNIIREAASGPQPAPGAIIQDDLGTQLSASLSLGYVSIQRSWSGFSAAVLYLFLPSLLHLTSNSLRSMF